VIGAIRKNRGGRKIAETLSLAEENKMILSDLCDLRGFFLS
jgi:hypothetical protein